MQIERHTDRLTEIVVTSESFTARKSVRPVSTDLDGLTASPSRQRAQKDIHRTTDRRRDGQNMQIDRQT